jgi:hypothetical protein
MSEVRLQDLSRRAQQALEIVLDGRPATLENISQLCQRDIWILPGFGRVTSNEIKAWAKTHGITMPDNHQ